MSYWQSLRSDRATQVRFGVGLVVGIFWFVYAISQFVEVGIAGGPPLFALALPVQNGGPGNAGLSVAFPRFTVCTNAGDTPPALACVFNRQGQVRTPQGQEGGGRPRGRPNPRAFVEGPRRRPDETRRPL